MGESLAEIWVVEKGEVYVCISRFSVVGVEEEEEERSVCT